MPACPACPACGFPALWPAGADAAPFAPRPRAGALPARGVCGRCGRCWDLAVPDGTPAGAGAGPRVTAEVDALACPGCGRRGACEACLSPLAESLTRRHVLADGTEIRIRPLVAGDRFELAAGYAQLSERSRRLRFLSAPDELDDEALDYLTNLDYDEHFACAAQVLGADGPHGVGVARYVRRPEDPLRAEVAVTVSDRYQRRGIGTLLTRTLADVAAANGVRRFVSFVSWDNDAVIKPLTEAGATIAAAEPGLARLEMDVPAPAEAAEPKVRRLLRVVSAFELAIGRWSGRPGPIGPARPGAEPGARPGVSPSDRYATDA